MRDLLVEIWSSLLVLSSIPGDWLPYSLLAVSSWNGHKVQIVPCNSELLDMLGLAFPARVVRAAINVAKFFKISTCSWLLRGPRSRARLSLPNGFLCMSIPAIATRLSTTHRRPISLIQFPSLMSMMICWAIGRMIASSFDWMCSICFWSIIVALMAPVQPPGSRAPGLDSSTVAHPWHCARYQRMIVLTRSYPMHCTVWCQHFDCVIIEKIHVMMWSSVALLISSRDTLPMRSLRVCASDWISNPPVLWINSWNWLSTFSKWDFVEMEYPVRNVAAFQSPPMMLCRPSDFCISAWTRWYDYLHVFEGPAVSLFLDAC